MPFYFEYPPPRGEYLGAVARLALLAGAEPARTINATATDSPGNRVRPISNPAYGAWDQARHSAPTDRAVVARYEGYVAKWSSAYVDVNARVAAGFKLDTETDAFRSLYAKHVADGGT